MTIREEKGTIETLSPQGRYLYAQIRLDGIDAQDMEGNTKKIRTHLVGNEKMLPEDIITMAETLVFVNVDLSTIGIDISKLIGHTVTVLYEENIPVNATLLYPIQPRVIPAEAIRQARAMSSNPTKIDSKGKRFLARLGYSAIEVAKVIGEELGILNADGQVIKYGNQDVPDKASKSEVSNRMDLSRSVDIVTSLPSTELKSKTCHIQIKAFSAKWK